MAKFFFYCRHCGNTIKQKGVTLQQARDAVGGIKVGEADGQGIICRECCRKEHEERMKKPISMWGPEYQGTITM